MLIGGAVITNGDSRTEFSIDNKVPLLRQKDIMSEREANSPCRRIYFVIQLMYVDEENLRAHHRTYWHLIEDLVRAAPSVVYLVDQISEHILFGRYYQALKLAKILIDYEEEVTSRARKSSTSLQSNSTNHHVRT